MPRKTIQARVGANIRDLREKAGLTQVELAEVAGVTARYVSIIEQGQRNLRLDTLEAFANALEASVCDLVCDPRHTAGSKKEALRLAIDILRKQYKGL